MSTNKKVSTAAPASATVSEATPISVPSSYLSRSRLSGNPLLKANAETKIYTNDRENGTTAILLAILGTVEGVAEKSRIVTIAEFASAFSALRSAGFKADSWTRTEKNYAKIGGNSGSIDKKIGPVVTGLIREGKNGLLAAFDPSKIATPEVRAIVGYKY